MGVMDKERAAFPEHRCKQWCFALFTSLVSTTFNLKRTSNRRKEVIEE
jgi:hypothetical protein